jgi:hypothetical protein
VRNVVLDWTLDPHAAENDPRTLLLVDGEVDSNLVAVVAHEALADFRIEGELLEGTRIYLLAV